MSAPSEASSSKPAHDAPPTLDTKAGKEAKPDATALQEANKENLPGESGTGEIKPVIAGHKPGGMDFKPVKEIKYSTSRPPGVTSITISGTKDYVQYRIKYYVYPTTTVKMIKTWMSTSYGYELDKIRLLFDGLILDDTDTMAELQVEEGDAFDVYLEQRPFTMPPTSKSTKLGSATPDIKPKVESKPTVEDIKPDLAVLENDRKPSLSDLEDEARHRDIKPAIPGLKPEGVDFKPVRQVEMVERYPGHFKIIIMGSKGGAAYRIKYMVAPSTTVQWLKVGCSATSLAVVFPDAVSQADLTKWYGYETDKIRLIFDGRVATNRDTMTSLQAEEGDVFDVYLEQLGG
ncbi:uncharacterized protein LOC62_02G002939 [Vanrija pseudolonga]|uniref:Ubiquitin-like domain-containing protein n=1 Tax=Vanrija pseudolonga TaxID=143232 RepID=A0AAF0Y3K8_9TREE|nr:hypothetical protein LOC62_02G002939 [Vanrija pseudolonga]